MFLVRNMVAGEEDVLGRVMWHAIHDPRSAYTKGQRKAWLDQAPHGAAWAERLAAQTVWVAVAEDAPVGVLTLASSGYIDLAFVLPAQQGRGAFSAMYAALEAHARAAGETRLWLFASVRAQPAFAAKGFHVMRLKTVTRGSQRLQRAEMEKALT